MVINAYFIVGNIGETEEQMLSTAAFARLIGVDLVHISRLRCEPYSGLRELVQQTPGYHIDDAGLVYSDAYSSEHIAKSAQADRPSLPHPASRGRGNRQTAANRAWASSRQGGSDDPRLSDTAHRYANGPQGAEVVRPVPRFTLSPAPSICSIT